jgi:hypothetical protein
LAAADIGCDPDRGFETHSRLSSSPWRTADTKLAHVSFLRNRDKLRPR